MELMLLGSLVMVAAFVAILRRQVALFTVVMTLGALCWVIGQALWLGGEPVHRVVWWWAGFLVLTIVGERLDLSRLQQPTAASRLAFVAAAGVLLVGLGRASSRRITACGWWARASSLAHGSAPSTSRGAPCGGGADALHRGGVTVRLRVAGRGRASPPPAGPTRRGAVRRVLHALFVGFRLLDDLRPRTDHLPRGARGRGRVSPDLLPAARTAPRLARRPMLGDFASWPAAASGAALNALAIVLFFALVVHGVAGPAPAPEETRVSSEPARS
jgi:hypothetical protein